MAKIIALASQKSGIGKSTTCRKLSARGYDIEYKYSIKCGCCKNLKYVASIK